MWGFNFSRNIYRKLEDVRWSGARLETEFLHYGIEQLIQHDADYFKDRGLMDLREKVSEAVANHEISKG